MALITIPNTFSAGAVIVASQHNSNFSTISSDYNGNIDNTNISASAAIAYSKLNLATSIVNADVSASAGIVGSKLNLTAPGIIGSVTPSTGAFTTLKVGTTNQGDILYDNGTSLIRLTPGTSGQFLKTQGAAANPLWANAGSLTLISTTNTSGAANTGDISITSTNNYKIFVTLTTLSANDFFLIRINNDTGANYQYVYKGTNAAGTGANGNSAASTSITTSASLIKTYSGADATHFMEINLYPGMTSANKNILIKGSVTGVDTAATDLLMGDFAGMWISGSVATSFRILSSGGATFTATTLLYQLGT